MIWKMGIPLHKLTYKRVLQKWHDQFLALIKCWLIPLHLKAHQHVCKELGFLVSSSSFNFLFFWRG